MPKAPFGDLLQYLRRMYPAEDTGDRTDGELLNRFVTQREEDAFTVLVQRHGPMVLSVCQRLLGDLHLAEDSFQATFIVLARRAASIGWHRSVGTWLYAVAQRVATKAKAKAAALRNREKESGNMPRAERLDEQTWQELRSIIDEEIGRLPEKYQAPLVLCYLESRSHDQAAKQLGCAKTSLERRLSRGRELLRQQLIRRGVTLSTGVLATVLCNKVVGAPLGVILTVKTVKAATLVATGKSLAGCVSAGALTLAEEAVAGMVAIKGKLIVIVLALGLAAGGAGWVGYKGLVQPISATANGGAGAKNGSAISKAPDGAASENEPMRVDSQGEPLPLGAISKLGSNRLLHGGREVVFSPAGDIVASASTDHTIKLWDPATGKELRKLHSENRFDSNSPSRWLQGLAFTRDGQRLACGEHLGGSVTKNIRIWEVATGKLLLKIEGHEGGVLSVAFSPDGRVLASASADETIRFWDGMTGQEMRRLTGHGGVVRSVEFSPDGKLLASGGDDQTIRLWDASSGREIRQMRGHGSAVESVSFSPDGKSIVSGSRDQTIRLWETETGSETAVLRGHQDDVLRVRFAPDGKRVASGSKDKTIRVWDLVKGKEISTFVTKYPAVSLSYSPDGKVLASSEYGRTILWDLASAKPLHPQPGHQTIVSALQFLPGMDTLVSLGQEGTIRWWDWKKGQQQRLMTWPSIRVHRPQTPVWWTGLAFGPAADLLAIGSEQGVTHLLDPASGKELGQLVGNAPVISLGFSPDGRFLVTFDGKQAQVWDVAARKLTRRLSLDADIGRFVLFAPDGKLLLGGNKTVRLWDLAKDQVVRDLPISMARVFSVAISPDSRTLFCGDMSGQVRQWDLETSEEVRVFTGLAGNVQVLAISPNRRLLAGGAWKDLKIWEMETGQERCGFKEFDPASLAFTPDGRALASGNWDSTILIWDIPGKALGVDSSIGDDQDALRVLWNDLASEDGAKVHSAIWGLVGRPSKAVVYLRSVLKPVPAVEGALILRLTKDLDSESFPTREQATKELHKLGDAAEPALRKLLADAPSLEARLRAKGLLEELRKTLTSPEKLQAIRAIEALEYMRTPAARELLRELSRGAPGARVTREATASLERLSKR